MAEGLKPMDGAAEAGDFADLPSEEVYPGVVRRTFSSREATVNSYRFEPEASFPVHSHDQEQITLVIDGTVEMSVKGEVTTLRDGSWSVVSGGVEHGITAGPGGASIIAMIVPRREAADDYELSGGGA
jgi:quercetin dioxygenase-like cupin family protein